MSGTFSEHWDPEKREIFMKNTSFLKKVALVAFALGTLTACGRSADNLSVSMSGLNGYCPAGQYPNFYGGCSPGNGTNGYYSGVPCQGGVKVGTDRCKYEFSFRLVSGYQSRAYKIEPGTITNALAPYQTSKYLLDGDRVIAVINNPHAQWGTANKCDTDLHGVYVGSDKSRYGQVQVHKSLPMALSLKVGDMFASIADGGTFTVSGVGSSSIAARQALLGFNAGTSGVSINNFGSACNLDVTLTVQACRDYYNNSASGCY